MDDLEWCQEAVRRLDEQSTEFTQSSASFSRDLQEIEAMWMPDPAARDVFARFLSPHQENARALGGLLTAQLNFLRDVVGKLQAAADPARAIVQMSEETESLAERVKSGVQSCHSHVDASLNEAFVARNSAAQAKSALANIAH